MAEQREEDPMSSLSLEAPGLDPEVKGLCQLYIRISDRVGLLTQMLRHCLYSYTSGSFRAFLRSPQGYNAEVGAATDREDFNLYYLEMVQHAIVMLHATVEEAAGEAKLKELAQLLPHRGATVGDLIRQSIDSWLDHQTFNNALQVAVMLEKLGVSLDNV